MCPAANGDVIIAGGGCAGEGAAPPPAKRAIFLNKPLGFVVLLHVRRFLFLVSVDCVSIR